MLWIRAHFLKYLAVFFLKPLFLHAAPIELKKNDLDRLMGAFYQGFPELALEYQKRETPKGHRIHRLFINKPPAPHLSDYWWKLDVVHASYASYEHRNVPVTDHMLFIFGGYLRLPGMTLDAAAKVLCHEMGHGFGGSPYKKSGTSVEGAADYYATRICLKVIFKYLDHEQRHQNLTPEDIIFTQTICQKRQEPYEVCLRGLMAIHADFSFYQHTEGSTPDWKNPSSVVAKNINHDDYFYPETPCRIDTELLGWFNLPRPSCWFVGGVRRQDLFY